MKTFMLPDLIPPRKQVFIFFYGQLFQTAAWLRCQLGLFVVISQLSLLFKPVIVFADDTSNSI